MWLTKKEKLHKATNHWRLLEQSWHSRLNFWRIILFLHFFFVAGKGRNDSARKGYFHISLTPFYLAAVAAPEIWDQAEHQCEHIILYLSTSLVFSRHVQEAGQASPSPTAPAEGPTSTASPWASSTYPPRVTSLLASQFLLVVLVHLIFYWHAVGLPDESRDTVSQRRPPRRYPQDCIRSPAPAGPRRRTLAPQRKTAQLSVGGICEVTSQNGWSGKLRELQGNISLSMYYHEFCTDVHDFKWNVLTTVVSDIHGPLRMNRNHCIIVSSVQELKSINGYKFYVSAPPMFAHVFCCTPFNNTVLLLMDMCVMIITAACMLTNILNKISLFQKGHCN